jgi:hypothetical protein
VARDRYTIFDEGEETGFWVCPEAINDLCVDSVSRAETMDAMLACADGVLRLCPVAEPTLTLPTAAADTAAAAASSALRGDGGSAGGASLSSVEAHSTPLEVELAAAGMDSRAGAGARAPRFRHMVWGSEGGQLGEALADGEVMQRGWSLANSGSHRGASVTCLDASADLTGDGVADLLVGRDDGQVQVFSVEAGGGGAAAPLMVFRHAAGESVRSLGAGCVSTPGSTEAVFRSFGGRGVSLTTEALGARDAEDRYGRSKAAVQKEAQVTRLRAELAELESKAAAAQLELREAAKGSGVDIADLGIGGEGGRAGGKAGGIAEGEAAIRARGAVDALRREMGPSAVTVEAPAGAASAQLSRAFEVSTRFQLEPADASYSLTVEAPVAIDLVVLESDVALDVLDAPASQGDAATGSSSSSSSSSGGGGGGSASDAIVSLTPPALAVAAGNGGGGLEGAPAVIATFRCQETSSRVTARLRSVEGQAGTVRVLVVSKEGELSTAQAASVAIKPLSLHYRLPGGRADAMSAAAASWGRFQQQEALEGHGGAAIAQADSAQATDAESQAAASAGGAGAASAAGSAAAAPGGVSGAASAAALSRLTIRGDFDRTQAHAFILSCFHDAPARVGGAADGDGGASTELAFRSSLLGGVVIASYTAGEALFESDSTSALAIIKEVIAEQAESSGSRITTSFEAGPQALERAQSLIRAPLERALGLSRRSELYAAVKEVVQGEEDVTFLSPELKDVLEHGESYKREIRGRPRMLELLFGVVTDLFVDWHKFHGRDVASAIPALTQRLRHYTHDKLLALLVAGSTDTIATSS